MILTVYAVNWEWPSGEEEERVFMDEEEANNLADEIANDLGNLPVEVSAVTLYERERETLMTIEAAEVCKKEGRVTK